MLDGLHQAQTDLEAPAPGTQELVERYQQVIAAFELRYGAKLH